MTETSSNPLAALLICNGIPLDNEVDAIKVHLEQCRDEAATLDAAILELQRQRESLQQTVDRYQGLVHPLRRNLDVLQEIFLHCLPEECHPHITSKEAPILLTHVCRQWRDIALRTPRLWDSMSITIPSVFKTTTQGEALVDGVKTWLSRTGRRPLRIAIYDVAPIPNAFRKVIIKKLLAVSPRWQTLVLCGFNRTLARLTHLESSRVPRLENLVINIRGHRRPSEAPSGLLSAPALRRLCLRGLQTKPPAIQFNWGNLSHISIDTAELTVSRMNACDALDIFRRCQNVVSARIDLKDDYPSSGLVPITAPRLRHLSIFILAPKVVGSAIFFETLRAPALHDFAFQSTTQMSGDATTPIREFLARSTSLERLTIHPDSFSSASLQATLSVCPALASLRLCTAFETGSLFPRLYSGHALDNQTLKKLTPKADGGSYLCPGLTTLAVEKAIFPASTLLRFIEARLRAAKISHGQLPMLRTLAINLLGMVIPDEQQALDRLPQNLRSGIKFTPTLPAKSEIDVGMGVLNRCLPSSTTAEPRNLLGINNILFTMDS